MKVIDSDVMKLTIALGECFKKHFAKSKVYCVSDVIGEDHIYAIDENNKPMFDMLVSTARKFVFVWYYLHPSKGIDLAEELQDISLKDEKDFVIKYPNIPVKQITGTYKWAIPSILRYGKKPAGKTLRKHIEDFKIKGGNPQLEEKEYSDSCLETYRNYEWHKNPEALDKIKNKAYLMIIERLKKHPEKLKNLRGMCLYAGCAYHMSYPQLGFGMRDIDVQAFFSPEWFTNTRCAFTRHCDIDDFGKPEYFKGKTRWLDLMWNSFHSETGNFDDDVALYLNEMRYKSDRWATISQRPIINLETKKIIYKPNWIQKLEEFVKL